MRIFNHIHIRHYEELQQENHVLLARLVEAQQRVRNLETLRQGVVEVLSQFNRSEVANVVKPK